MGQNLLSAYHVTSTMLSSGNTSAYTSCITEPSCTHDTELGPVHAGQTAMFLDSRAT